MLQRALSFLAVPALAATLVVTPAAAQTPVPIAIATGQSTIVHIGHVSRVAVGDGNIAGIVPLGTTDVMINGKHAGRTTVFVWSGGEQFSYVVSVTDQSVAGLGDMIRGTIDESDVTVTAFGQALIVRGTVLNLDRAARITDVIDRFSPLAKAAGFTIVDAVTVTAPYGSLVQTLADFPKAHDLRVDSDAKGNLIVTGQVDDRMTAEAVLDRVRGLAGAYLAADAKVVDRLAVARASQINVKVYVLEIDHTGLSQLGVSLQGANPDPNLPGVLDYGAPTFLFPEASKGLGKALTVGPFFRQTLLAPTLDLILQSGHARILSEPNLVTTPGHTAKFLVGGEVPYAYSTGLGEVSVVFKEYGVKLEMTPTILGDGSIDTKLTPEVSDLDFSNGIQQNGFVVPALKTSRIATEVVTRPGESIVMGGLLSHMEQRTINKIPLLGDLPIIGKLFRSTKYQHSETDVVFVMTPEILTQ